jgi:hypothetical protein
LVVEPGDEEVFIFRYFADDPVCGLAEYGGCFGCFFFDYSVVNVAGMDEINIMLVYENEAHVAVESYNI